MAECVKKSIAVEDCIMQKGYVATAGSKMLKNFISPVDAEVLSRLYNSEFHVSTRVSGNEFGIDKFFDKNEPVMEPVKTVLENKSSACLCNDLFGIYRRQACSNNLIYIHPTYGTVSRYGLIPSAPSMDQIGILCREINEGFEILSLISGNDPKDGAMLPTKSYAYKNMKKGVRIAAPLSAGNIFDNSLKDSLYSSYDLHDIELPYFELYSHIMFILCSAEISNSISRYDGVKYGYRSKNSSGLDEMYINSRTEGLSFETKLLSVVGSLVLSKDYYEKFYEKALKLRHIIKDSLKFDSYDVLLLPAKPDMDKYKALSQFAVPQLLGLPSLSFSLNGYGVQLIANINDENSLLELYERLC